MPEGTVEGVETPLSFDEAVKATLADLGEAIPEEPSFALPADKGEAEGGEDQVDSDVEGSDDQPEEEPTFDFDDDESDKEKAKSSEKIVVPSLDAEEFEVPGIDRKLSLRELASGYMRQEDYTRKTQELADLRRQAEQAPKDMEEGAANLWQSLKDDPVGTAAWLAVRAGLIDSEDAPAKLREVEKLALRSEADIQAEVERRVQEAVKSDPRIQEATLAQYERAISSQFSEIEKQIGQPLSEKARIKTLDFASANGIPNLVIAFNALRGANPKAEHGKVPAAPERPKLKPRDAGKPLPPADSFEEAAARALADLGVN